MTIDTTMVSDSTMFSANIVVKHAPIRDSCRREAQSPLPERCQAGTTNTTRIRNTVTIY